MQNCAARDQGNGGNWEGDQELGSPENGRARSGTGQPRIRRQARLDPGNRKAGSGTGLPDQKLPSLGSGKGQGWINDLERLDQELNCWIGNWPALDQELDSLGSGKRVELDLELDSQGSGIEQGWITEMGRMNQ